MGQVSIQNNSKFENEPNQGFREPKKQLTVNPIIGNLYSDVKFYL